MHKLEEAPLKDIQFSDLDYHSCEFEHLYGEKIHLIKNPYLLSLLTKFSMPFMVQPILNMVVKELYTGLVNEAVNNHFEREQICVDTRMKPLNPNGQFSGEVIKNDQRVVTVNLARAGTFPSHLCFEQLSLLLNPEFVRQDHFYLNRKTNDNGEVIGVDASGSKIGGDVEDAIVLFPDPMGATGGSLCHVVDYYKNQVEGKAKKIISLNLIVTPEFVRKLSSEHPDVEIYALRMDRGLSDKKALASIPGKHPELESGLNEIQYIVPGAGGVGEILNNSYV
jgi:uracil phosphoribosyltransferase